MTQATSQLQVQAAPTRLVENCPGCGYSLHGLPDTGTCPECGASYDQETIVLRGWTRRGSILTSRPRAAVMLGFFGIFELWLAWDQYRHRHGSMMMIAFWCAWLGWVGLALLERALFGQQPPLTVKLNKEGCLIVPPQSWLNFMDFSGRDGFWPSVVMAVGFAVYFLLAFGKWTPSVILIAIVLFRIVWRRRYLQKAARYNPRAPRIRWYVAGRTHPMPWPAIRSVRLDDMGKGRCRLQIESDLQQRAFLAALIDAIVECTPERAQQILIQCNTWGKAPDQRAKPINLI